MTEMNEPENEGISIIWKIEEFCDKRYHGTICFNWREDQEKKWKLGIDLGEYYSRFDIEKLTDIDSSTRLSGMLFLLDIDGSEWNLGNFKDFHFIDSRNLKRFEEGDTYMPMDIKSINDFPLSSDNSRQFISVRVHLWEELELFKREPPMLYNVSSSLVEQSCSFDWTVKSDICDGVRGTEYFRYQSTQVPRNFVDYCDMKFFNFQISFVCEDFWLDKARGRFEISNTPANSFFHNFSFRIRVIDNEGKYMQLSKLRETPLLIEPNTRLCVAPETLKLLKAKKYKYYPDGNLQMICDISICSYDSVIEKGNVHSTIKFHLGTSTSGVPKVKYSSGNRTHGDGAANSVKNSKSSNLNTSMYKLFKDWKLCDVVLIVGEKKFHCHKTVLCSRSPVFLAMFENETQENQSGTIHIVDTDADTISLFLSVLYNDVLEVKDLIEIKKLYEVADKYLVTEVVQMCSGILKEDLSSSNFCEILALADSHQDEDLIDLSSKYFIQYAKSILETKEWLELMSVNPTLTGRMMYLLSINTLKK